MKVNWDIIVLARQCLGDMANDIKRTIVMMIFISDIIYTLSFEYYNTLIV